LTDLGLNIPVDVIIDSMYACYEGIAKQLLTLFLDSTNHGLAFYVGLQINRVDDKFINVRYSSEFPRSQRSILNFKVFKANELRNFLIYSAIYIFKDILPVAYY
jgi:hypothetical protein